MSQDNFARRIGQHGWYPRVYIEAVPVGVLGLGNKPYEEFSREKKNKSNNVGCGKNSVWKDKKEWMRCNEKFGAESPIKPGDKIHCWVSTPVGIQV